VKISEADKRLIRKYTDKSVGIFVTSKSSILNEDDPKGKVIHF